MHFLNKTNPILALIAGRPRDDLQHGVVSVFRCTAPASLQNLLAPELPFYLFCFACVTPLSCLFPRSPCKKLDNTQSTKTGSFYEAAWESSPVHLVVEIVFKLRDRSLVERRRGGEVEKWRGGEVEK